MNPHKATLGKSNERGPKRKNSNVGIRCKESRTINPHKATLEKSNERGPKRKNSNVGIRCEKVKQ